jgi:predicted PurR-regulated permease PerM
LLAVWLLAKPLALLVGAIAIAEALAPPVDRLERRMPRALAVTVVYLLLGAALAGLAWLVVPRLAAQATTLAEEAPELIAEGRDLIGRWDPGGEDRIVETLEQGAGRFTDVLVALPLEFVSTLTVLVLVLFMSAYWLIARPAIGRFARSLLAPAQRDRFDEVCRELGASVGGYVRGEAITAVIVGGLTYAGLRAIGVDYALTLALLAGIAELVPVVGPIAAAIPAVLVGFLDSPTQGLIVLGFYAVLQQLESNVIMPNVVRHQAHVPPLLALFAIFAGAELGGILGALVAIPIAGALKVLAVRVAAPAVRRWTGATDGGSGQRAHGTGR